MTLSRFGMAMPLAALLTVSACVSPETSDGYTREVHRMTAGASVISAIEKMCGAKRIDAYRAAFIAKMQAEQGVTEAGAEKIRAQYARADQEVATVFPTPAKKAEQCARLPRAQRQAMIDRGVAGDFTGQI